MGSVSLLERDVGRLQIEQISHQRDDERLRDRLAVAARQRHALVGQEWQLEAHERVTRRLGHRVQHAPVQRRLANRPVKKIVWAEICATLSWRRTATSGSLIVNPGQWCAQPGKRMRRAAGADCRLAPGRPKRERRSAQHDVP